MNLLSTCIVLLQLISATCALLTIPSMEECIRHQVAKVGCDRAQAKWSCENQIAWNTIVREREMNNEPVEHLSPASQALAEKCNSVNYLKSLTDVEPEDAFRSAGNKGTNGGKTAKTKKTKMAMALRKEYRMLSDEERDALHKAVNVLKKKRLDDSVDWSNSSSDDSLSIWDTLVTFHNSKKAPGAHGGQGFLGWHREYLNMLEIELREVNANVSIPYWDSSMDRDLPNPADSIIWTRDFLGNNRGNVVNGPFANWSTVVSNTTQLYRNLTLSFASGLLMQERIDNMLYNTSFQEFMGPKLNATNCRPTRLEQLHNFAHPFVGGGDRVGQMGDIPTAPNDPVFYMHHAFIDMLWEMYRLENQNRTERETQYSPDSLTCDKAFQRNAKMEPFPNLKLIDGHSNRYTDEFYSYDPRPVCGTGIGKATCGSPYLFCHRSEIAGGFPKFRCMSKIIPKGNCTGLEDQKDEPCYKSKCVNGICQKE